MARCGHSPEPAVRHGRHPCRARDRVREPGVDDDDGLTVTGNGFTREPWNRVAVRASLVAWGSILVLQLILAAPGVLHRLKPYLAIELSVLMVSSGILQLLIAARMSKQAVVAANWQMLLRFYAVSFLAAWGMFTHIGL